LTFEFLPLRLHFTATDRVVFPKGTPSNTLRGAFGSVLKRIAPAEIYARIFEPRLEGGPSGLADAPRPFVFRARHLDGRQIAPGEAFYFDVNIFDLPDGAELYAQVFAELGRQGLGAGRGRAELTGSTGKPGRLSLEPGPDAISGVRIEFLTPTELKSGGAIVERPEFTILFARLRDRISTLSAMYGSGPLPIDFAAIGERAAAVKLSRCDITLVKAQRRSSRTGQTHSLGGFIGSAEYEGDLREALPFLEAGQWTGVGRQTVWGKGEIATVRFAEGPGTGI
jgi:hypothetical protein